MADPQDFDLEEKLMQVAFSDVVETSSEIFKKLGRTFKNGEVLFREGERSTELVMIISGKCQISKGQGKDERVLAQLQAGEILGEMSHFDDAPRSATASAVGDLNVLWLTRENFGMVFELHHKWTIQLIVQLAKRIAGTFSRLLAAHDRPPPTPPPAPLPAPAPAPVAEPGPSRTPVPAPLRPVSPVPAPAPAATLASPSAPAPTPVAPSAPALAATVSPAQGTAAAAATAAAAQAQKLEQFYGGIKAALLARTDVAGRSAMLATMCQSAAKKAGAPAQQKRVEDLFRYVESRLRVEGLLG